MKIKFVPVPKPEPGAKFKPRDFDELLQSIPEGCVLIGGQAVAWWAERYQIRTANGELVDANSKDIDFWGKHADLFQIAGRLKTKPALPHKHEMTAMVGAIAVSVEGKRTVMELLHTVPGLDVNNPKAVAVPEAVSKTGKETLILTPVSLVLTKLYNLRQISQEERQDLFHLQISLKACRGFISEVLLQNTKFALWNCNRLIQAHGQSRNRRLEQEYGFNILSGIPVENIRAAAHQTAFAIEDLDKLHKFLIHQWPRVSGEQGQANNPNDLA